MFDITGFELVHGSRPSGHGLWIFRNKQDGRTIERTGVYSDVKTALIRTLSNPSAWMVCP